MRTVVLLSLLGACVNDRAAPPTSRVAPPTPDATPAFVVTPPMDAMAVTPGDRSILIAKDRQAPTKIVVTPTDILWLDEIGGNVVKVPKAGGALVELATKQERPLDLAVDAGHVYWTTRTGNDESDSMTAPKHRASVR